MDHATSNKKKRWRCRCLQSKKERRNRKEENKENYDEEELIMICLNQKHDTIKKYPKHDEVLMPLVVFLNNRIDYQGKNLERKERNEGMSQVINQGKKIERKEKNIEHVRNVMNELNCSYQRATNVLKLSENEKKSIEKYFQS